MIVFLFFSITIEGFSQIIEEHILLNLKITEIHTEESNNWFAIKKKDFKKIGTIKSSHSNYDIISDFLRINANYVWNELRGIETLGCCEKGNPNEGISLLRQNKKEYDQYIDKGSQLLSKMLSTEHSRVITHKLENRNISVQMWNVQANICKCSSINQDPTDVRNIIYLKEIVVLKAPCKKLINKFHDYFE